MSSRINLYGLCIVAALAFLAFAQSARAAVLLSWEAAPLSASPEINFTGSNLQTGSAAIGNGDGTQPIASQTAPGLEVDTIVSVPLTIPGSFASSTFTGGTGFYDATLTFSGLAAPVGSAYTGSSFVGTQDNQPLSSGSFTITSTTPVLHGDPSTEVVLLTGTLSSALITGLDGDTSGAIFSSQTVDYTGGAIFNAFPSNFVASGNSFSISMTNVSNPFGITSNNLNPFTANASGVDDVRFSIAMVPEPGSFALAGIAGLAALAPSPACLSQMCLLLPPA